jgi:hypothetical protein
LLISGNNILAGTYGGGIYLSSDNGNNWTEKNSGLKSRDILSLSISGNNVYAGTQGFGIFMTTDDGNKWIEINNGLTGMKQLCINSIVANENIVFAGTCGDGIFLSTNFGNNWIKKNKGLTNLEPKSLSIYGNYIFAGTNGGMFRAKISDITGVEKEKNIENIVYPNPANDFLIIHSVNSIGKEISIYDMLGNKLETFILEDMETRINIESLSMGIYFVRIGEITKTFIKE